MRTSCTLKISIWYKAAICSFTQDTHTYATTGTNSTNFLKLYHLEHEIGGKKKINTLHIILEYQNPLLNTTLSTVRYTEVPCSWPTVLTQCHSPHRSFPREQPFTASVAKPHTGADKTFSKQVCCWETAHTKVPWICKARWSLCWSKANSHCIFMDVYLKSKK